MLEPVDQPLRREGARYFVPRIPRFANVATDTQIQFLEGNVENVIERRH